MDPQPVVNALVKLCEQILVIFLPILIAFGCNWLKAHADQIKSNQRRDWLYELEQAAEFAVGAAEQYFGSGAGEQKKDYAISVLENYLKGRGVDIDLQLIDAAVEQSVLLQFNLRKDKPLSPAAVIGAPPPASA